MKNNKLTAKYIKDVFRFMEMYHIRNSNIGKVWFEYIPNSTKYKYNISVIIKDTLGDLQKPEIDLFTANELKDVLDKIKDSKHYMMDLEV